MAVMLWAECESVKSSIFKEWCCVLGQPKASNGIPFFKVSSKHPIDNSSLQASTMAANSASAEDMAGTSCFHENVFRVIPW